MTRPRIGLIGYGEVGRMLGSELAGKTLGAIAVYDLRFDDAQDPLRAQAASNGLEVCATLAQAASDRDLVISAVTAGSALEVAEVAAPALAGAFLLDLNSVSPSTKQAAAAVVEPQGRYVEAAVMAPVAPRRIATPMLFGGPHAREFLALAETLGFRAEVQAETVGTASAVKMCRSVFVKGLESIVTECLVSARRYGVEAEVLSSLSNTVPAEDWPALAAYLISRPLIHGRRRSEEMGEVVRTLHDAGLDAWMSEGAVRRQAWAQELGLAADGRTPSGVGLNEMLDAILSKASPRTPS